MTQKLLEKLIVIIIKSIHIYQSEVRIQGWFLEINSDKYMPTNRHYTSPKFKWRSLDREIQPLKKLHTAENLHNCTAQLLAITQRNKVMLITDQVSETLKQNHHLGYMNIQLRTTLHKMSSRTTAT